MTPGAYLRNMRERRGHATVSTLASYMQSLEYKISREALRQYESNKALPGDAVRDMIYDALLFTAEDVSDFERVCAEHMTREKFNIGDAYLVDAAEATRRSHHIIAKVRVDLYGIDGLTEEQVQFILTAVEKSCQTALKPSPPAESI